MAACGFNDYRQIVFDIQRQTKNNHNFLRTFAGELSLLFMIKPESNEDKITPCWSLVLDALLNHVFDWSENIRPYSKSSLALSLDEWRFYLS